MEVRLIQHELNIKYGKTATVGQGRKAFLHKPEILQITQIGTKPGYSVNSLVPADHLA